MSKPEHGIVALGQTIVRKLRLSNALGGPIVIVLIVTPISLWLYYKTLNWLFALMAVVPVLYFGRVYDYFMKTNPKYLRSEEHTENMFKIAAGLGHKGHELPDWSSEDTSTVPTKETKQIGDKES